MVPLIVRRVIALLLPVTLGSYAAAQQEMKSASITVRVADERGNAVRDARVHFVDRSLRNEQEQVTDESGSATADVHPGNFDLTVTSPGFPSLLLRNVEIKPSEHKKYDLVLKEPTDCCMDPNDSDLGLETENAKPGNLETENTQPKIDLRTETVLLRKFLQNYATSQDSPEVRTTRYVAAFLHLRDDNTQQVIVYLIGPTWCGTGGCTALILISKDSSYALLTEMGVAQQPIRILETKTNGWHDLGVWVQGGGIQPGYEAKLSFDGKSYPGNPTVPPAQRLTAKVKGNIVVPYSATGEPLYP